jgi:hypothetical protein
MPSEYRPDSSDSEILDLDRADFSSDTPPVCALCSTPITNTYFSLGQQLLCSHCSTRIQSEGPGGVALTRAFRALALGLLAAIVGSGLWLAVTELTGYQIGLIAIVVGMLVGGAVRMGARQTGGIFYQLLAVGLTYTAIVMTYVPAIATSFENSPEFREEAIASSTESESEAMPDVVGGAPVTESERIRVAAWLIAIPIAFAAPFLMGFENIIGILIIGFALWQAWVMNKPRELSLSGPFELGAAGSTGTPPPIG